MTPSCASFQSAGVFSWLTKSGRIPSQTTTRTCREGSGVSRAGAWHTQKTVTIPSRIDTAKTRFISILIARIIPESKLSKETLTFSAVWVWRFGAAVDKQQGSDAACQCQCRTDKHNSPKSSHERFIDRLFYNLASRRSDLSRNFLGCQADSLILQRTSRRRGQLKAGQTRIKRTI